MRRPTITEPPAPARFAVRIAWFVGLWAASIAVFAVVAYGLRLLILG